MGFDGLCRAGFLAVLMFPTAALANPLPEDHGCLGHWVGRGRNTGYSTYWTIDLILLSTPEGTRCGTIEYTNPACGGFLEACQLEGDDIHTRENYTHRAPDCAPPGRVIIRCEGDTMRYSWIGWERVDTILHRAGPAPGANPPPPPSGTPSVPPLQPNPGIPPTPLPSPPNPAQPGPAPVPSTPPLPTPPPPANTPSPSPMPSRASEPDSPWGWVPGCATAGANPTVSPWFVLVASPLLGFPLARRRRIGPQA